MQISEMLLGTGDKSFKSANVQMLCRMNQYICIYIYLLLVSKRG